MKIEQQARYHQSEYSDEKRKSLGVHYTPDAIVEYIVRRVLQSCFERGDSESIRNIAIVDPACGSGLFLLKAFDVLCSFWKQHFGQFSAEDARYILENNLYGVDIDASAVHATQDHLRQKAKEFGAEVIALERTICQGDAVMRSAPALQLGMSFGEDLPDTFDWQQTFPWIFTQGGFDCIVGNPPYVRIQHIQPERRAKYAELYETARGRFDIAGLFVELGKSLAKPSGRIGYIVSNKLLSVHAASRLRDYILTHYTLVEIVDLVDTKLFEAAVLPMILILENKVAQAESFIHASIQEVAVPSLTPIPVEQLLAPLEQTQLPLRADVEWGGRYYRVEKFASPLPTRRQRVWAFQYPTERHLVEKLRENAVCTLASVARKISVGLKTTADNVFIKPMTLEFIERYGLEREVVFPVLESHNIKRWQCHWTPERDLYVLYPHREQNGKVVPISLNRYPNVERYLLSNRQQLESRTYLKESGRQWYEIWVHQSPSDFRQRKLVTPDIALGNSFALDDRGAFINGTCFYIILRDQSLKHYLLMLGLLNSKVLEFFHKAASGNALYAKRFRYWTSYLKPYPIPDIAHPRNSGVVEKIIENTRRLVEVSDERERSALEDENNRLVYRLFSLTDQDIQTVESSLAFQNTSN